MGKKDFGGYCRSMIYGIGGIGGMYPGNQKDDIFPPKPTEYPNYTGDNYDPRQAAKDYGKEKSYLPGKNPDDKWTDPDYLGNPKKDPWDDWPWPPDGNGGSGSAPAVGIMLRLD